MVKYVNTMSKVILQRGTKEERGLMEGGREIERDREREREGKVREREREREVAIKCFPFSITLARGGAACGPRGAAGVRAASIESHIAHKKHEISFQPDPSKRSPSIPFSLLVTELSHTF